jgi:acetate kinase
MNVLVLNSGSSSLKFQLIATDIGRIAQNRGERLCLGLIEWIAGEAINSVQTRNGIRQNRITARRVHAIPGNILFFASGHFMRVLASRWLGIEPPTSRYSY